MSTHKKNFELELKTCNTLKEIFLLCEKYYEIEKPLTTVSGVVAKAGISRAVDMIRPTEKKL